MSLRSERNAFVFQLLVLLTPNYESVLLELKLAQLENCHDQMQRQKQICVHIAKYYARIRSDSWVLIDYI